MATLEQDMPAFYTIKIGPPVWPGPEKEFRFEVHDRGETEFRIFEKDLHKFTDATGLQFPKGDDVQLFLDWKTGKMMIASFAPCADLVQCTLDDYGLQELLPKAFFAEEWIWRDRPE